MEKNTVFLDIEYIGNGDGIVEISCVAFENQVPKIVYSEILNPKEFKANRIAFEKVALPQAEILKGKSFSEAYDSLYPILTRKKVVHWSGQDLDKINNACAAAGLPPIYAEVEDLMATLGQSKLKDCFFKLSSRLGLNFQVEDELHCSKIDSLMLALVYASHVYNRIINENDIALLKGLAEDRMKLKEKFNSEQKASKRAFPANEKGEYYSLGLSIYFTKFEIVKSELKTKWQKAGFSVMSSRKAKSLDFLVIPDALSKGEYLSEYQGTKTQVLYLREFEAMFPHAGLQRLKKSTA